MLLQPETMISAKMTNPTTEANQRKKKKGHRLLTIAAVQTVIQSQATIEGEETGIREANLEERKEKDREIERAKRSTSRRIQRKKTETESEEDRTRAIEAERVNLKGKKNMISTKSTEDDLICIFHDNPL